MDVRTYVRTDGHLRPALLGRLYRRVDLKSNNNNNSICTAAVDLEKHRRWKLNNIMHLQL